MNKRRALCSVSRPALAVCVLMLAGLVATAMSTADLSGLNNTGLTDTVTQSVKQSKGIAVKKAFAAVLPDLAGTWGSNIGLTYTITQSGTQYIWTDNNGATGIISLAASGLTANWTDGGGPHSATGVITESDAAGRPMKIAWSNDVVFQRASVREAALTPIQLPAPQTQSLQILTPPPPPPPPPPTASGLTPSGLYQLQVGASGGAFRAFLKIKTIQGDSSDPQHRNEIELTTFGWGGRNAIDATSPGLGSSGRVEIQPFTFTMPVNSASPYLFLACARGEHIPEAILTVRNSAGREYLILELHDVFVTSYITAAGRSQDVAPIDEVAMGFGRMIMTFRKFKIDGSMEGQFRIGWDIARNTMF